MKARPLYRALALFALGGHVYWTAYWLRQLFPPAPPLVLKDVMLIGPTKVNRVAGGGTVVGEGFTHDDREAFYEPHPFIARFFGAANQGVADQFLYCALCGRTETDAIHVDDALAS